MEYIICLVILGLTIVLLKFVFKINLKEVKELEKNEKLKTITDKFPDNITLAKSYLEMLDNKDVKVEETSETKTSLYIAVTNKIIIASIKSNYTRLQIVAHECLHSVQDRRVTTF